MDALSIAFIVFATIIALVVVIFILFLCCIVCMCNKYFKVRNSSSTSKCKRCYKIFKRCRCPPFCVACPSSVITIQSAGPRGSVAWTKQGGNHAQESANFLEACEVNQDDKFEAEDSETCPENRRSVAFSECSTLAVGQATITKKTEYVYPDIPNYDFKISDV
uniref:Uncharacterized protein n=1 Tax=Ditylenchus dipsaci TaxID=166011 RepID=A0A915E801_9BILA